MKLFLKKFALVGLMLLYGFVVTCYSRHVVHEKSFFAATQHPSKNKNFGSVAPNSLLSHTASAYNTISIVNSMLPFLVKNSFSEYTIFVRHTDRYNESWFLQYNYYSTNILARLRQPDIIFPFHYFW